MLVLAGSSTFKERTHQAAQLFKEGRAPKIILTNDNQESGWSAELQTNPLYVQRAASELKLCGVPEENIEIVPETVSSTRDEAARVREYAASSGLHSILVVTSAYQVRRARWTFDQMFAGSGVVDFFLERAAGRPNSAAADVVVASAWLADGGGRVCEARLLFHSRRQIY